MGPSILAQRHYEVQILVKISRHRGAKRFVGSQLSSLLENISKNEEN